MYHCAVMEAQSCPSSQWKLIRSEILVSLLRKGLDKTLLIDSRSFLEYNTSRIQQSVNLCCSKLVKRKLQQDKVHISELLTQACHIDIEEYSDVIVYDQCTEKPEYLSDDNFLLILLKKLASCSTFKSVALLKGGYLAFNAMHPILCENKANNNYKCTPLTSLSQPCLPVANIGPTRILPFLYLGSHSDAMSQETIQVNEISYILNVSTTCPKPPFIQEGHFCRIPVNDNYSAKLLPFFEQAFQFVDKVREANGCVMVHCLAGISRSPTLAIAYVMRHLKMSSDEAYRYVKDKRPTISPNFNFLGQLLEYEKIIKQEEENLKNRRDSGGSMSGEKSIQIIMDLQNCSPSSPVSKVSKPFVFEPILTPSSTQQVTSENKRDNNDNLPLLADSDTWADFAADTECSNSQSEMCTDDKEGKQDFKVPLAVDSEHGKESSLASGLPRMDLDPGVLTPSSELPPFSFGAMPQSKQPFFKEFSIEQGIKRKSPSLSPKSPASRSFTLSLSPVALPLENKCQKTTSFVDQTRQDVPSQERKRTLRMAMSESSVISPPISRTSGKSNRPVALPLSPLISPCCDLMSPSSDDREKVSEKLFTSPSRRDRKSLVLPLSSPCTETKPFTDISKCGKSSRPFTLSLSPVISPDTSSQESDITSSTFQSTEKTQESKKLFNLPLSSVSFSDTSSDNSSQVKFCKSQRLPISPLVSSDSDSSTLGFVSQSSSGSNSPKKSPSRSLHLPLDVTELARPCSDVSSADCQLTRVPSSSSGVTNSKRAMTLSLSSSFSQPEVSSSSDSGDASHLVTEMAAKSKEIQYKSQHNLSFSEKSNSVISNTSTVKAGIDSTLAVDKPVVPKSLAFSKSQKKHISQNLYSPSTALAQLHFSQTIAEATETTSVTNPNLTNFPSTSLDKLNFTPCLASKVDSQDVDMPSIASPLPPSDQLEAASPLSVCSTSSSTCSSAVTSPSNIPAKVILRSRDNRAKRTMIRPNSIAFSKYPTFDLGSDCQESPSSGSSTSQDDASEMYMLQNGKRTKHSDAGDKFKLGKYSEREVYKQISAMESAMLKSQVYEASRKARSLDDILTTEASSSSSCVTSVLQKSSRHCGLAMDRFGSSALYENFPYRCRGSSDPYQSNSSISSSGSHSSLHGSMEIIQNGECPQKRRKTDA